MKKIVLFVASCLSSAASIAACGGDDTANPVDAGHEAAPADGSFPDTSGGDAQPGTDAGGDARDGASDVDAGPPPPPRLLLSMNNATTSELVALNLTTNAVDGRLTYPGFIGTTSSRGEANPWLMEQSADVVAKLDPRAPWQILSTWSVALPDRPDGGAAYADPYGVVVSAAGKGYVLRYTRNEIAVIDATETADGGAPTKTIDLSGLVQPADGDGLVDMSTAFYVSGSHRLYVLLGNFDRTTIKAPTYDVLCVATTPSIIAIDVTTDQVVPLGGSAPGGGIALAGHNPAFGPASVSGAAAAYDAANGRLLIVEAGCNPVVDGGEGAPEKRIVEEVNLTSGAVRTLLDMNALDLPIGFSYIGPTDAVIGFGFGGVLRRWDPTSTTIGPVIPNAPDNNAFAYDGAGALVGTRTTFLADGGTQIDVVRTILADGGTTTLAPNPFTDPSGFVGGVELWQGQ